MKTKKEFPFLNIKAFKKHFTFDQAGISINILAIFKYINAFAENVAKEYKPFKYKDRTAFIYFESESNSFTGKLRGNKEITFEGKNLEELFKNFKKVVDENYA